jgi:hypothetical protein
MRRHARSRDLGRRGAGGLCGCIAVLAWAVPAAGQARRADVSIWNLAILTVPASDKVEIVLDGHVGLNDRAARAARFFARGVVYYRAAERLQIGGGFGAFYNDEPGVPAIRENRLFIDVNFRTPERARSTSVQLRSRLERRQERGDQQIAWQARQLVRVELPLSGAEHPVRLIGWHESFVAVNGTRWSGMRGQTSMFNFVGLGLPLAARMRLEAGYLNVTTVVPGRNRLRHGPALIVTARF